MTDPTPIDRLNERTARLRLKLTEAAVDFYATLGLLDPRDLQAELDGWGTFPVMAPPYYRQSQKRGEVLPVYTTEEQLRLLRDRSRKLRAENEFAICAVETRKSYVVGKGFVYRAAAAHKDCPASLLERVQKVLDWWDEANDLASYAADMMDRLDTDGESFTRFFPQKSGLVLLRPVEPEHVRSPQGDAYGPEFSFGVQTDPEDVEDVKGYWIVESPLYNPSPAFVPAGEVMHARLNVPRSAKRGLPTFYPVEQNLRRAEDLLGSMTSMAKTRAKIALIRKFNGLVKSTVQSMTDELTEATATDPSTGNAISLERLRFGTILNSSGGIDYEMPSADVQASDYVAVLQAELRAIASRLCMPEWMLTADASNANYSSSLVAEAPSTKMFERLQRQLARQLGESRERSRESAAWRQLRHAVRVGLLPREVYQLVKVQVEAPSLVVRDRAGEATMNAQYLQARIKSPQTIAAELGLDYEQEQHNFRAADKFKPKESPQGQGPAALGEAEERKDKSGHRYCVEPGHGRVDCADDGEGPADAGARGEGGLTPADSGTLSKLATLGQKVMSGTARLEHGAKEYITRQVAKLPAAIRKPVAGAYRLYFASYLAAEKAVEVVARERGLPEEKVKQVVKIVTVVDLVAGAKLVPGTLAAAGLGAFAAPAAFIPVGSLGYLAYSTARDPAATLRAARQAVQGLLAKLKGQNKEAEAAIDPLLVRALVRRAQLVSDLDQYAAYLLAALDETHGDAPLSLRIADQLAGLRPGRQQEVKIDRDSLGRRYCTDEQTGKRVDCPDDSKDTKDDSKGKVQKRQPPKPDAKGKGAQAPVAKGGVQKQNVSQALASYPKPAKWGRDPDASGLPLRGKDAKNYKPWDPVEKSQSIAKTLSEVGSGAPGDWTTSNAVVMERVLADVMNFDHWGEKYPADMAGVMRIKGKAVRIGIDSKVAVLGTTGNVKKDPHAEVLKMGFVSERPDQKGFNAAASLSNNKDANIRSLMYFLCVNANHQVKEIRDRDPKTGKPLSDANGQPIMKKAGLLYLQAGCRPGDYSRMVPIEVEGLNDVRDLAKPEILVQVREKIVQEIRNTDIDKYAEAVLESGKAVKKRLVKGFQGELATLAGAGVSMDTEGEKEGAKIGALENTIKKRNATIRGQKNQLAEQNKAHLKSLLDVYPYVQKNKRAELAEKIRGLGGEVPE